MLKSWGGHANVISTVYDKSVGLGGVPIASFKDFLARVFLAATQAEEKVRLLRCKLDSKARATVVPAGSVFRPDELAVLGWEEDSWNRMSGVVAQAVVGILAADAKKCLLCLRERCVLRCPVVSGFIRWHERNCTSGVRTTALSSLEWYDSFVKSKYQQLPSRLQGLPAARSVAVGLRSRALAKKRVPGPAEQNVMSAEVVPGGSRGDAVADAADSHVLGGSEVGSSIGGSSSGVAASVVLVESPVLSVESGADENGSGLDGGSQIAGSGESDDAVGPQEGVRGGLSVSSGSPMLSGLDAGQVDGGVSGLSAVPLRSPVLLPPLELSESLGVFVADADILGLPVRSRLLLCDGLPFPPVVQPVGLAGSVALPYVYNVNLGELVTVLFFRPQRGAAACLARVLGDSGFRPTLLRGLVDIGHVGDGVSLVLDAAAVVLREYCNASSEESALALRSVIERVGSIVGYLFGLRDGVWRSVGGGSKVWCSVDVASKELADECHGFCRRRGSGRSWTREVALGCLAEAYCASFGRGLLALDAVRRLCAMYADQQLPAVFEALSATSGARQWEQWMADVVRSCVFGASGAELSVRSGASDLSCVGYTGGVSVNLLSGEFDDLFSGQPPIVLLQRDSRSCGNLSNFQMMGAGILSPEYLRGCMYNEVARVLDVNSGQFGPGREVDIVQRAVRDLISRQVAHMQPEVGVDEVFNALVSSDLMVFDVPPQVGVPAECPCLRRDYLRSEIEGAGDLDGLLGGIAEFKRWCGAGVVRLQVCTGRHWFGMYRRRTGQWVRQDSISAMSVLRRGEELMCLGNGQVAVIMFHPGARFLPRDLLEQRHFALTGKHMPWVDVVDGKPVMMLGESPAPRWVDRGSAGCKRAVVASDGSAAGGAATVPRPGPFRKVGAGAAVPGGAAAGGAAVEPRPVPARRVPVRVVCPCKRDCLKRDGENFACFYCWSCGEFKMVCWKKGKCGRRVSSRRSHYDLVRNKFAPPSGYPSLRTRVGRQILRRQAQSVDVGGRVSTHSAAAVSPGAKGVAVVLDGRDKSSAAAVPPGAKGVSVVLDDTDESMRRDARARVSARASTAAASLALPVAAAGVPAIAVPEVVAASRVGAGGVEQGPSVLPEVVVAGRVEQGPSVLPEVVVAGRGGAGAGGAALFGGEVAGEVASGMAVLKDAVVGLQRQLDALLQRQLQEQPGQQQWYPRVQYQMHPGQPAIWHMPHPGAARPMAQPYYAGGVAYYNGAAQQMN